MNTNSAATSGTRPSQLFISNKSSYAIVIDVSEIFDHAHLVFRSVSFIQMLQILARKTVTSRTKPCSTFLDNFAVFDFTSTNGDGFVGICCPATGAVILLSQIGPANATVHSTGSDECSATQRFHSLSLLSICRGQSCRNVHCGKHIILRTVFQNPNMLRAE
jgi:hypothetical protein